MRRAIWPVVLLLAVSAIAAGTLIFASSGAQERPTAITGKPWNGASGTTPPQIEAPPVLETVKISGDQAGSKRYPAVAENSAGDRLVIFMGHDSSYWYSVFKKGGSWSAAARIPGQPALDKFLGADIDVDSSGRFHCVWEKPGSLAVYGSFLNGSWTTPFTLQSIGGYDMGPAIAVRSNDEVLVATDQVINAGYLTKDVFLHVKGKNEDRFRAPKNLTNDRDGSCQAWIAVDSNNHLWMVHKSDYNYSPSNPDDILVIYLTHFDANNNAAGDWKVVSATQGYSFWPQVAVNSEGKVMTTWAHVQSGDYFSRLFNPATGTLSSLMPLNTGLSMNPWCTFWSKLVAHGEDFYVAALNPARILYLLKYDAGTSQWTRVAQISDTSVQNFDLYAGSDKMLVAWGENDDPADIFLTTVEISGITSKPTLTIKTGAGGTTDPVPGSYRYDKGSPATIRAIPDAGYRLSSWSGDASGNAASITVTMDRNLTVTANFVFIPIPKPPLDPILETALEASQTTKINTVTWQRNPGNAGLELKEYWIYRKRAHMPDGDFTKIASVPWETLQYLDKGLPVNQKFTYGLTASPLDPYGKESPRSESVTEINAFPPLSAACKTVVNYSLFRKEKINRISWQTNPLNDAVTIAQYNIYRKRNDQEDTAYKLIASVSGSVVEYQDRKLLFSESYVYVIRAVDSGGYESGASNPAGE